MDDAAACVHFCNTEYASNNTRWSFQLYAAQRLLRLKSYVDIVVPQPPQFWVDLRGKHKSYALMQQPSDSSLRS